MARGNVPAAVCSASLSNIAGVFIAPLLAGLFIHSGMEVSGGFLMDAIGSVALELLAPFVIGHLMRPLIGGYVDRHRLFLGRLDRGRSEEHTSELQSLMRISYAVFCLKKKKLSILMTYYIYCCSS